MKHLFLPQDSLRDLLKNLLNPPKGIFNVHYDLRDLSDDFFDEKYDLGGDIFDLFCHIFNRKDDIFNKKGHSEH